MIELRPYRVYLFDIDGTLLNCGGVASQAAFLTIKEDFAIAEVVPSPSFCGRTDRGILSEMFALQGLADDAPNNEKFYQGYTARLAALLPPKSGQPIPGVIPALTQLNRAVASPGSSPLVTIMTGNCEQGARIKLEGYGIEGYFALERGGYGDHHPQRDDLAKATFAELARALVDLTPDEILVIGDTPADITCARAIGADCLAVTTGSFAEGELAGEQPRYLASSFADVAW